MAQRWQYAANRPHGYTGPVPRGAACGDTIITMPHAHTPMRRLVILAALGAALISVTSAAHAQSETPPHVAGAPGGVAVWTASPYVERGTTIAVHGYGETAPITILVLNPSGNLADVIQLDAAGPFSIDLHAGGAYWKPDGWYRLTAKAGSDSEPFPLVLGVGVRCDTGAIPVDAGPEGVHCMMSEGVAAATLDAASRTMAVYVSEGGATMQIPRYMLDSRTGEADADFGVVRADAPIPYEELASDADFRTITIPSEGWAEVSGTHAVPEFAIAVVALAAAAGAAMILPRLRPGILKDS